MELLTIALIVIGIIVGDIIYDRYIKKGPF